MGLLLQLHLLPLKLFSINFLYSILFSCSVFILLSMKNNAKRTHYYNNCTCDLLIFSLRCLLSYLLIELNCSAVLSGSILKDTGVLFLDLIIISAPELSKLVKNKAVIFSSSSPSSDRFLTTEGVRHIKNQQISQKTSDGLKMLSAYSKHALLWQR